MVLLLLQLTLKIHTQHPRKDGCPTGGKSTPIQPELHGTNILCLVTDPSNSKNITSVTDVYYFYSYLITTGFCYAFHDWFKILSTPHLHPNLKSILHVCELNAFFV